MPSNFLQLNTEKTKVLIISRDHIFNTATNNQQEASARNLENFFFFLICKKQKLNKILSDWSSGNKQEQLQSQTNAH